MEQTNRVKKDPNRHKRVRCIDPRSNSVKWIPAHAVEENVRTYGLIVQDLPEKEEKKLKIPVVLKDKEGVEVGGKPIEIGAKELGEAIIDEMQKDQVEEKPKRGRKPKE